MKAALFALALAGCATTRATSRPHDTVVGEWTVAYIHGPNEQWARAHDLGAASLRPGGKAILRLCERTRFAEYDIYCDAITTCVEGTWKLDGKELTVRVGDRTWRGDVNHVGASFVWFVPIWGPTMEAATFSPSKAPLSCDQPPP